MWRGTHLKPCSALSYLSVDDSRSLSFFPNDDAKAVSCAPYLMKINSYFLRFIFWGDTCDWVKFSLPFTSLFYPSTKWKHISLKCNSLFNNYIAWCTSEGENVITFQMKVKIRFDLVRISLLQVMSLWLIPHTPFASLL